MYMCKCTLGVWHRVNMAHYHLSLSKCGNMIRSILTGEPNLELYFNYSFTATYNIYFFCLLPTTKNAMTCIILYAVYAYFMGICLTQVSAEIFVYLICFEESYSCLISYSKYIQVQGEIKLTSVFMLLVLAACDNFHNTRSTSSACNENATH
jgi:hypothetical protein